MQNSPKATQLRMRNFIRHTDSAASKIRMKMPESEHMMRGKSGFAEPNPHTNASEPLKQDAEPAKEAEPVKKATGKKDAGTFLNLGIANYHRGEFNKAADNFKDAMLSGPETGKLWKTARDMFRLSEHKTQEKLSGVRTN